MILDPPRRRPRAVLLGLVVGCLLAGLVGMHHLSVTAGLSGEPAAVHVAAMVDVPDIATMPAPAPAPAPAPHDGHESALLHLCLAVLTAFALLLPLLVLRMRGAPGQVPSAGWTRGAVDVPAVPPPVSRRLAQLCVLRT